MNVKIVAIDIVGVLVTEDRIVSRHLYDMLPNPKPIRKEELKARYDSGLRLGKLAPEQFWAGVSSDWCDLEQRFLKDLSVDATAEEVLRELAARSKVALVSDVPKRWANYICAEHGWSRFISLGVFSDETGIGKGSGESIAMLCKQAAVLPDEVVYVDDKKKNLLPTKALGVTTVWYRNTVDDGDSVVPDYEIGSLRELLSII